MILRTEVAEGGPGSAASNKYNHFTNKKWHEPPFSQPVCKRQTPPTSHETNKNRSPYEQSDFPSKTHITLSINNLHKYPPKKTVLTFSKQFSTSPSLHLRFTFATTLLFVRFDIRGIAMMQQCAIKNRWYMYRQNINIFLCKSAHMQRIWQKGEFVAYR